MRWSQRLASFASSVAALIAASGCERGCLSRRLDDMAQGGLDRQPGAGAVGPDLLGGTDCSDGLLRCVDGRVEASTLAHLPRRCETAAPKLRETDRPACECPWRAVAECSTGCALEGLEVIGEPSDAGARQLCRPDVEVARPPGPADSIPVELCASRGASCVDGVVRLCEEAHRPIQPIAVCLNGCQSHLGVDVGDPGTEATRDGAVMILCRRDHAERR